MEAISPRRKKTALPGISRYPLRILAALLLFNFAQAASAAYLLQIDTDGADDGPVSYNAGFAFGNDTTTASQSAVATAYGTTPGDSIFGGDGNLDPDTYIYTYTPSTDADNLVIPQGTDLGSGNLASGGVGGGIAPYRVYILYPYTENVSGGPTRYTISTPGAADVVVDLDQNGAGDEWIPIGDITLVDPMAAITVTQQPTVSNSFVSMRAFAVLFEAQIPPPLGPPPLAPPSPPVTPGADAVAVPALGVWALALLSGLLALAGGTAMRWRHK